MLDTVINVIFIYPFIFSHIYCCNAVNSAHLEKRTFAECVFLRVIKGYMYRILGRSLQSTVSFGTNYRENEDSALPVHFKAINVCSLY